MLKTILLAIIGLMGLLYLLSVIGTPFYYKWGMFKFFYHDFMDWHSPDDNPKKFDGCNMHARCKHCGKDIMQDSQGNWF